MHFLVRPAQWLPAHSARLRYIHFVPERTDPLPLNFTTFPAPATQAFPVGSIARPTGAFSPPPTYPFAPERIAPLLLNSVTLEGAPPGALGSRHLPKRRLQSIPRRHRSQQL